MSGFSAPSDVEARARRALWVGTSLAIGGAALYGANIPAARVASQAGLPGADLIAWRAVIFVPLLAALLGLRGEPLGLSPAERGPVLRLALAASLTAIFYLSAIDHLPVPMAVTVFYTFPLYVMLLMPRLEGRRLPPMKLAIFALAFLGLTLAVGPSIGGLSAKGLVFAFLAALCSAAMFVLAGRVSVSPFRSMFWSQLLMGPLAFLFAFAQGGLKGFAAFSIAPIAIALAMGAYAIAYGMQLAAAQRISPARAGLLFLFEPVMAVGVAWLMLGETLGPVQMAGLVLILLALAAEIGLDRPPGANP